MQLSQEHKLIGCDKENSELWCKKYRLETFNIMCLESLLLFSYIGIG